MDPYFPIILTQNALLCLGTSYYVYRSTILCRREKWGFYLTIYTGLLITLCELISTMVVGRPGLIWLQTLTNYVNIGLTPLLPVLAVLILGKSRNARIVSLMPVVANLILMFSGRLFTIAPDGSYHRDPLFWTFITAYVFNMLLLTYRSFAFSSAHQNHNALSLLFICCFMISSTTIQLRHPQIHFSWFCVTVTVLLYFIYYVDTIHKMDPLTGLLNRIAFLDYSGRSKRKISGVLMIDLDDFKNINDSYGHLMGDRYLIAFGQCMRSTFKTCGYCYRMGGDEFCILLDRTRQELPIEKLMDTLQIRCDQVQGLPEKLGFSYGYAPLPVEMSIDEAVETADKSMYASKAERKKRKYS